MKVLELTERQMLDLENRRKDVRKYLERDERSTVLELEDRYFKRTKEEIIDRIMSLDDQDIAKIHKGEALDQPQFDEDER